MYAAGKKRCSSLPKGGAADGGEPSRGTLTAKRTTERQAGNGARTGVFMCVYVSMFI